MILEKERQCNWAIKCETGQRIRKKLEAVSSLIGGQTKSSNNNLYCNPINTLLNHL